MKSLIVMEAMPPSLSLVGVTDRTVGLTKAMIKVFLFDERI